MLIETTLIGSIIAVKYIAALVAGSGVAGAGLGAGFFHLFSKRKNPLDDPINTERQERQEQRQQALDGIVTETTEKLNTTFQGLETNSNAFTTALSRFKGFFDNIFGRTEDLNKVVESLEQSKDERIVTLLQSQKELSAQVKNLTTLLESSKKLNEELNTKIQGIGDQFINSATQVTKAQEQLKKSQEEKDELLKKIQESNSIVAELSSNLDKVMELLEQKNKELEQIQHPQETKKAPGFFS